MFFDDKIELKKWIINYINIKGKRSLHVAINNSNDLKSCVVKHTINLPIYAKINQRCYHIINDIDEIPLCKECGDNYVNFSNRDKEWRYLEFCSAKCGRINKDVIKKYKITNIKKYGVDNFSKTDLFKNKMINENREKYGVDWYQQSKDFKLKSIKTCLDKYGVTSYVKTNDFKSKVRETILIKYGVDWYTKSIDFTNKFKKTCLDKYGFEHFMISPIFSKSSKKQFKDYKLPSGKIIKIQGYEHFALDILLGQYSENDILVSNSEIRNEIGILNYFMDDKDRIYIPDIYIKSCNKIIEVKSKWTYEIEIDKNELKKKSCLDNNILFEFWIFNKFGKLTII